MGEIDDDDEEDADDDEDDDAKVITGIEQFMDGVSLVQVKKEWSEYSKIATKPSVQEFKDLDVSEAMSIVLTDPNLLRKAPTYARLLEIILVIPMSSVACERGASLLKRALSNFRSRLKATKLDAEMYIAANGAPVWEADIDAYVTAWRGKDHKKILRR